MPSMRRWRSSTAVTVARTVGDPLLVADALLSLAIGYSRSGQAEAGLEQFELVLVSCPAINRHK